MSVAAMLAGAVHQPLDLALSEIAPFDCQVYDGWCAFLGCRFHADKPCLRGNDCLSYTLFLHSIALVAHGVHRGRSGGSARLEPAPVAGVGKGPPVGRAREIRRLIQETLAGHWRLHVDRSTRTSCSRSLPTSKSTGRKPLQRCGSSTPRHT